MGDRPRQYGDLKQIGNFIALGEMFCSRLRQMASLLRQFRNIFPFLVFLASNRFDLLLIEWQRCRLLWGELI